MNDSGNSDKDSEELKFNDKASEAKNENKDSELTAEDLEKKLKAKKNAQKKHLPWDEVIKYGFNE